MNRPTPAALVTADGSIFEGEHIGPLPPGSIASGEVVFNTSMTGYQEILSDPSYAGQIVTFTYPHIGNYGTRYSDNESNGVSARGVIVRELARRESSWRAEGSLASFLAHHGLSGLAGIDTRRLTRLIRDTGAMPGAFGPTSGPNAVDLEALTSAAKAEPGTDGTDLVGMVSTSSSYKAEFTGQGLGRRIVAYDFGIKSTITANLAGLGEVTVVPASTTASEVLALEPHGVFLSNGPGDPELSPYSIAAVAELIGQVPIFGICLGHQIMSLAVGGTVEKLPFGHHGANHPVMDRTTGKVEITSQNHNFAVVGDSVADVAEVTHVNLNDGVCEGLALRDAPAFSVQHHPEASPGPHDSSYLFGRFDELMNRFHGGS